MKRSYGKIDRKPKAYSVTGLSLIKRLTFVEKRAGYKDRKENQLCITEDGQTTPYVESRHKHYESYVNNAHLWAEQIRETEVKDAEKLIAELKLILNRHDEEPSGNVEEISRAKRLAVGKKQMDAERKEEIVLKLSEIKSFLETLDEKLSHHVEAAGDLMDVHVANYWRGILKASQPGEANVGPFFVTKTYDGRQRYREGSDETFRKLSEAIALGGGADVENI